ncbi:hypothetical protein NKH75_32975 [Mesorhizobium sp. M0984]|uniref:sulfotransferase n=1 Tax=Mesorhizobium sp. M0984 TaxID=2957041 RepID=UPI00333DF5BC
MEKLRENDPGVTGSCVGLQAGLRRPAARSRQCHSRLRSQCNGDHCDSTPGRLLVHNLGDGWEPLCLHLGVAVPDQSYPNRNNTKEFQSALAQN